MPIQRKGMRALQIWCQRVTNEYDNVHITDLTTSFRDGLAFCAIIHHFRPDLMPEYHSLKPENIFYNNDLAYKTAEEKLDIPNLLDPQDMVDCEDPDKFSVVTYVSQYYHLFKDADGSCSSPNVSLNTSLSSTLNSSRSSESENDSLLHSSSESTPLGTPTPSRTARMFNQADLIAKYGEEIFSTSEKKTSSSSTITTTSKIGINSICNDMIAKARISEEKES